MRRSPYFEEARSAEAMKATGCVFSNAGNVRRLFERIESLRARDLLAVFGLAVFAPVSWRNLEWKSERRTIFAVWIHEVDFRWKFTNLYLDGC